MKKFLIFFYTIIVAFILVSVISCGSLFDHGIGLALFIGAAPGGIGTPFTFNLPYLPEYIYYNDAGNPLTNLRVETQEDGVLHDWDAGAIAAMNGFINVGALAANDVKMVIASGHMNRTTTISGVTSAVGAINIFVGSDNKGVIPMQTARINIIANQDTQFTKFSALFLPNVVTITDRIQIFYEDGHAQIYDAAELQALSVMFQDAPSIVINNLASYIKDVRVLSALGGAAYLLRAAV